MKDYKKILEGVVDIINTTEKSDVIAKIYGYLSVNCPELKESEDERIRKEMTKFLITFNNGVYNSPNENTIDTWLAWLEKQGKQKTIWHNEDEEPKRGSLILLIMQSGTPIVAKIIEPNHTFNHGERWAYIDDLLEKQGEQKNTDKVEPKFKIGDWIANDYCAGKIIALTNDAYLLDSGQGIPFSCEHNAHLWTIDDAKDGDVLHATGWHSASTFIFSGLDNWKFDAPNGDRAVATGYCCLTLSADKMEFGIQGPDCIEVNTVKPATKIQRDLLFQKMKEAGYTFDFEKKELNKIEQKIVWWSEEDEREVAVLEAYIRSKDWSERHIDRALGIVDELVNKAKSLRPQNTWKPSKEQIIALRWILNNIPYNKHKEEISGLLDQINELKG